MITWIQELWVLIKMLFTPIKTCKLPVFVMKHFPFKGYKAMMWCGNIITRDMEHEVSEKTQNHERIHLLQAARYGSWCRYYLVYLWEWLKGNPFIHPSRSAYYTIPFEMEAYANEDEPDYLPTAETLELYDKKRRKALWNTCDGSMNLWRAYLKELKKKS